MELPWVLPGRPNLFCKWPPAARSSSRSVDSDKLQSPEKQETHVQMPLAGCCSFCGWTPGAWGHIQEQCFGSDMQKVPGVRRLSVYMKKICEGQVQRQNCLDLTWRNHL